MSTTRITLVLLALAAAAAPAHGQVLRQVNQAVDGFNQFEVDLALNPANPQQLVAAYIEEHSSSDHRVGVSISNDGGSTWTDATDPPNPYQINGDPSVAFDSLGNILVGYLSYDLAATSFQGTSAILVARSTDGGNTWQSAVVSRQLYCAGTVPFEDKPWIAVDASAGSSYTDTVHVVWQRDRDTGTNESDIYYSRGTFSGPGTGTCVETCPGGAPLCMPSGGAVCTAQCQIQPAAFSTPLKISDTIVGADFHNAPVVGVGAPSGEVFVTWLLADVTSMPLSGAKLLFDRDQNGGTGGTPFATDITVVSSFDTPPRTLATTLSPPATGLRMRPFPSMAVDPTTPTFGSQNLYVAYAADPDGIGSGDESDVYLVRSTDSGGSWSPQGGGTALNKQLDPFEVPNPETTTNAQFHPRVAVSPGGPVNPFFVDPGTVMVAWYDRRNDTNDNDYEIFTATIRATAQTITPGGGISSAYFPTDPNPSFQVQLIPHPTPQTVGEYLGLVADKVEFVAAWPDTRTSGVGDIDIASARWFIWDISVSGGGAVCTAPVPLTAARLVLSKLDTPPGDDGLALKGEMVLPAPISPPLDLVANGARVLIDDNGSILDVTLPSGAYDRATGVGWKVDRKVPPTRWTWVDRSAVPPGGIVSMIVRDASARMPGLVTVRARGRKGSYPVAPGGEPGTVLVVLDPGTGAQCGEATFPAGACTFDRRGRRLTCR
jgi:hypothetical protein